MVKIFDHYLVRVESVESELKRARDRYIGKAFAVRVEDTKTHYLKKIIVEKL